MNGETRAAERAARVDAAEEPPEDELRAPKLMPMGLMMLARLVPPLPGEAPLLLLLEEEDADLAILAACSAFDCLMLFISFMSDSVVTLLGGEMEEEAAAAAAAAAIPLRTAAARCEEAVVGLLEGNRGTMVSFSDLPIRPFGPTGTMGPEVAAELAATAAAPIKLPMFMVPA